MVDDLRSVMLPARLERGCTRAQILRDVDAAESIDHLEGWQSPKDIEERIRSKSFSRLLALMEAAPSPPSIEFRDVSGVHGLEYVAAVREPSRSLSEALPPSPASCSRPPRNRQPPKPPPATPGMLRSLRATQDEETGLRIYRPGASVVDGTYTLPVVVPHQSRNAGAPSARLEAGSRR